MAAAFESNDHLYHCDVVTDSLRVHLPTRRTHSRRLMMHQSSVDFIRAVLCAMATWLTSTCVPLHTNISPTKVLRSLCVSVYPLEACRARRHCVAGTAQTPSDRPPRVASHHGHAVLLARVHDTHRNWSLVRSDELRRALDHVHILLCRGHWTRDSQGHQVRPLPLNARALYVHTNLKSCECMTLKLNLNGLVPCQQTLTTCNLDFTA